MSKEKENVQDTAAQCAQACMLIKQAGTKDVYGALLTNFCDAHAKSEMSFLQQRESIRCFNTLKDAIRIIEKIPMPVLEKFLEQEINQN